MILEICAGSVDSAIAAQKGNANRIELCTNLNEGGTTPSYGNLLLARQQISIDLYALIRPRSGDFLYSTFEFEIMKADTLLCKELGYNGIAVGLLNSDGSIDMERTKILVELAAPMGVTFHRAFDSCNNFEKALEDVISCGCERILTSGLKNTAIEGSDVLKKLLNLAKDRIIIMPGSGIKSNNIKFLKKLVPAKEWHASAKTTLISKMNYHNIELKNMGNSLTKSDENEIGKLVNKLNDQDFL